MCPVCQSRLALNKNALSCKNGACGLSFPVVGGVPVLIDEKNSVFSFEDYREKRKTTLPAEESKARRFAKRLTPGISKNFRAEENYRQFKTKLLEISREPLVLVVGGASEGEGINILLNEPSISLVESDISFGDRTALICDAQALPFADESLDGIVVQAVLEHLLKPEIAVSEIRRTLKPGGLVYAETPFIQQVHMGRYDYYRFTHLGHRWLFRDFEEIESGAVAGPGVALAWSYRAFLTSFAKSKRGRDYLNLFARLSGFWLKYFDHYLIQKSGSLDSASCYFFLGRKSKSSISEKELIAMYKGNQPEY